MRKLNMLNWIKASLLIILIFAGACTSNNVIKNNVDFVDPDIGGVGLLLQPTRPTVQLPNQMIRMYPVRQDYLDDQIRYFPLTLISHRLGELFGIMPFTDKASSANPLSSWDPQLEITTPYYYSTWLGDFNVNVEFSAGTKTGMFRFTFPENAGRNMFLRNVNEGNWQLTEDQSVTAWETFKGMKAFVYGRFNQKPELSKESLKNNKKSISLSWPSSTGSIIEFRYGVSFISPEQAQKNFENEIRDISFDKLKESGKQAWDKVMNQISVKGGTDAQKRSFYTALYRCYERMIDITEEGNYYSNYDGRVHSAERNFYVDDWTWDTYLALHPLRTILDPETEADMVQSYVNMYEQSGWLPTFPVLWGDNPCMNGFHSTIMILDAYRKGIRDFDIDKAYEAMKKNSLEATMLPWRNGPAVSLDKFYHEKGFYPALKPGEAETEPLVHSFEKRQSVAVTLGHSYDDWALAQMAKELGKTADYDLFINKSENYKNLYWPEKGFFMPKDGTGQWIDIDPKFDGGMGGRDYYDENNGWTYLWQVQHNIPGLMELMGGKKIFEDRLDQLFREGLDRSKYETWAKFPDFSGIVGQFSMGNEPSFHIPYLYNMTDSPWKAQKKIRMLLDTWYMDNIFGIPGDEDGGGMSAFVVFSSMGFYPLIPGLPVYTIVSPLFEEVSINIPGGKTFTVLAPGGTETNKYIQKAWLNGKVLDIPFIKHEDIINGGVLKLEMGPYPNKEWGKGPTDALFN